MTQWIDGEIDLMCYWITEREAVRTAKEAGKPKPWTADSLLRDYRWCNVRRMDDRVSRELFAKWYPHNVMESQLTLALLARLVNWPQALDEVIGRLEDVRRILSDRAQRNEKIFTGAYVVPGVPGKNKVDSICDLVEKVSADEWAVLQPSMHATWGRLIEYDGIGSFLAGQVVADLAHLRAGAGWNDRQIWAPIGPGSARGINRLRGITKDKAVEQADFERILPELITVLRPRISSIWSDRDLHAMDAQNCLCEFDKFRRLQLQEGRVRAKYPGATENNKSAGQLSLL